MLDHVGTADAFGRVVHCEKKGLLIIHRNNEVVEEIISALLIPGKC